MFGWRSLDSSCASRKASLCSFILWTEMLHHVQATLRDVGDEVHRAVVAVADLLAELLLLHGERRARRRATVFEGRDPSIRRRKQSGCRRCDLGASTPGIRPERRASATLEASRSR